MKRNVLFPVLLGLSVLVGCAEDEVVTNESVKEPEKAAAESDNTDDTQAAETQDFTLTEKEQTAYDNYSQDLNDEHLAGLDPLSIAKLHIYASLERNDDVHYALYTDREGHVAWSKEEDEEIPESHKGTKESILKSVEGIEDGEFVQQDEISGYIAFENNRGTGGYQMVKSSEGNWRVAFMPVQ